MYLILNKVQYEWYIKNKEIVHQMYPGIDIIESQPLPVIRTKVLSRRNKRRTNED